MGIKIRRTDDEIEIDGVEIVTEDGKSWAAPKELLKGLPFSEMPKDIVFDVCDYRDENFIYCDPEPYSIKRKSKNVAIVTFGGCLNKRDLRGNIEVDFVNYMEATRDVIKEHGKEIGNIILDSYEDDGDHICINYSTNIKANTFDDIIALSEQFISEIKGLTDIKLGIPIKEVDDTKNEKEFSQSSIIPLLRRLGFSNVKYNHGDREFGKDITFTRKTEFDDLEYWGVQVKYGDISGSASSEINTIISQLDDAFKMPFYDLYSKKKARISKLIIAITGHFTNNAIEKICEKIESTAIKNNTLFFDKDKIDSLIEKVR